MNEIGLVLKAAAFAAHKHRDQRRKDAKATPYINHPLALAQALCEEGGVDDPIILAAALLHDTIEDTETSYDELRGQFGARIADIVAEVTDTSSSASNRASACNLRRPAARVRRRSRSRSPTSSATCATSLAIRRRSGRRSRSASTSTGRRR